MKAYKKLIVQIKMLQKALLMDEVTYREMLSSYKVESSKQLSVIEAEDLIARLEEIAVKNSQWKRYQGTKKYDHLKHRPAIYATPKQLRMLSAMWRDISFVKDPVKRERSLDRFLQNRFGIMGMQTLLKRDVERVLHALNAMYRKEITQ